MSPQKGTRKFGERSIKEKTLNNILSTVKKGNKCTMNCKDTSEHLLSVLVPDDNNENEYTEHKNMREYYDLEGSEPDNLEIGSDEIKSALDKMKSKRAPGIDGITVQLIKKKKLGL